MKTKTTASAPIAFALRHGLNAAAIALVLVIAGCGGGGGSSTPAAVSVASPATVAEATNTFKVNSDTYGLQKATFLTSSKTEAFGIMLRAGIATGLNDINAKQVSMINILPDAVINTGTVYSLAAAGTSPAFPGKIYFPNGQSSSLLKTVDGTISFTNFGGNTGDRISGSFNAVMEDDDSPLTPKPLYTITASFDYITGSSCAVAAP